VGIVAGALTSVLLRLQYSLRRLLTDTAFALIGASVVFAWGMIGRYGDSLVTPGLVGAGAMPIMANGVRWLIKFKQRSA
jgi:hypothetical protein